MRRVRDLSCGDARVYLEFEVRRVRCRNCGKVKRERLDWLADNPFYTRRFMTWVGRRCRGMSIRDVARETKLDWKTVKALEKEYMQRQLDAAGTPAPQALGIDELSQRRGHNYRIVVSDLLRRRAIWFGGADRSEASLDEFYRWLGPSKTKRIRLAAMDMWKPFRASTKAHAPQARIVYDKFHIVRHLSDAMDEVRKREYYRADPQRRRFIKGQRWTLLRRREHLDREGREALKLLLKANRRIQKAYLLKESFGHLWDYSREAWARRFFERWKASLRWQRLQSFEKFARMIERHWEGIASYAHPEHKVPLGFVEGLNNKIRVFQRRAYGLRDPEYLRLKVLTCMLPEL